MSRSESRPPSRIVVTGASSGIGKAVVLALAEPGVSLWLVARSGPRLDAVRDDARARGATVHRVPLDLMNDPAIDRALGVELAHDVDALIHSAGVVDLGTVEALTAEAIDRNLQLHYRAPWRLTRGMLAGLRRRRGQVVFVNSGAGHRTGPGWVAYAAAKHAMRSLTEGLREEEREHGVRVIGVYPGRVATPMQVLVRQQEGKPYEPDAYLAPEAVAEPLVAALRAPRDVVVYDLFLRP